jgi:hypothetical protein
MNQTSKMTKRIKAFLRGFKNGMKVCREAHSLNQKAAEVQDTMGRFEWILSFFALVFVGTCAVLYERVVAMLLVEIEALCFGIICLISGYSLSKKGEKESLSVRLLGVFFLGLGVYFMIVQTPQFYNYDRMWHGGRGGILPGVIAWLFVVLIVKKKSEE